ncbi:MAG: hypothetical protein ABFS46_02005, partial [Myxococcota bacterium]
MSTLAQIRETLRGSQGSDGGLGARAGTPSRTETTALAALALADDPDGHTALAGTLRWLNEAQAEDGSWPVGSDLDDRSWSSSLAVLALAKLSPVDDGVGQGARWLTAQVGRAPGWRARLIQWLRSDDRILDQDPGLQGWPWVAGASSWVEPTACALLALKALRPELPRRAEARIEEGERLVYDRMCTGGGWNYGNSVVFDEALEPYPDVTAIALLALQDRAGEEAHRLSLGALRHLLEKTTSGLALSWASLCLDVHGQPSRALRERIEGSFRARGFLGDVRTLALASLALDGGAAR